MDELDNLRVKIAKAKGLRWFAWRGSVFPENSPVNYMLAKPADVVNPGWKQIDDDIDPPCMTMADFGMFFDAGDVPDWPRDIAVAWELVEEMRGSGFQLYEPEPVDGAPKNWCCCLYLDGAGTIAEAYADNAPEAIARCWLAWKEAQHVR